MTTPRDPDRLVRAFLDEGPTVLPDRAVESLLGEIHRTRQRAVLGPWRTQPMFRTSLAAAAVIAVVAIGGLAFWATRPNGPVIGQPSSAPSAVASASANSGTPSPSGPAPAAGTIVYGFLDTTAEATYLYAIAPDGTGKRKLTDTSSCCLTLSADGRNVLYADSGWTPTSSGIDGGIPSQWDELGLHTASHPTGLILEPGGWSTRSDLAFAGTNPRKASDDGIYLSIANGGGLIWGELTRLTTASGEDHPDIPLGFSPDGSKLLFLRDNSPNNVGPMGDLFVIGIDSSGLRQLNPPSIKVRTNDLFGPGASWSPDGLRVAFSGFDASKGAGRTAVYVVSAAVGAATAITEPEDNFSTSARWSPDGSWIAFDRSTGAAGDHDVWLVHPDGSGLTNITSTVDVGVCCSQWSPDSSKLLMQGAVSDSTIVDLWIAKADGSGHTQLTAEPGAYFWYAWGPADK
jgi:Tol biopolymer transport system component